MGRVQLFINEATIGRLGYSAVPGAGKVWAQQGLRTQSECKHGNVEHSDNVHRCSACKQGKDAGQSTMLKHGNTSTVMTQAKADSRSSAYTYGKNAGRGRCSACEQGKDAGQSTMLKHGNASTVMTQAKPEVRHTHTAKTQAEADVQHANKANPRTKAQYSDAAQAH